MRLNKLLIYPQLLVLVFLLSAQHAFADHLKGGWIKYSYIGTTNNTVQYSVSFYQYSDCREPEKVDAGISVGIYDAVTFAKLGAPRYVTKTSLKTEEKDYFGPCFTNAPDICYLVAEYTTTLSLPLNTNGYILTAQRCCRIQGIANVPNSNTTGLTYTITIPGGVNSDNNSPVFDFNNAAAICFGSFFSFDFSAKDIDGDQLVYSLCSGITGGNQFDPVVADPPAPPYASIPYYGPYSGKEPLGSDVTIDAATGQLSGIAPQQIGTYVVAVCVDEYRNGVFISHTRKELHLEVSDCRLGGAQLDPSYITCDGYSFNFVNKAGNNPEYNYYWDFGVAGTSADTSTKPDPTYTYPDSGTYVVHLSARNNAGCQDSAHADVRVYPGFTADFSINGSCIKNPYDFKDLTVTKYGFVNSWQWFFGEDDLVNDTTQNPIVAYRDTGQKTITLVATNSKGCIDTTTKILQINNGPNLNLNFIDTLICSIDTLQLKSSSSTNGAVFTWSPAYNLSDTNSREPFVYPKTTTTYNVKVSDKGCVTDSAVTVNVIDKVTLSLPPDTAICKTDSILLTSSTNALYFAWSPPEGLSSNSVQSPLATPLSNTKYSLTASVGKCLAKGDVKINVVPYPAANAGNNVSICYGKTTQLNATITGSSFSWSPANTLVSPKSLSSIAGPSSTTAYILSVTDTLGCPKPATDTVVVTVVPKIIAFAGNDTNVVRTQPLQLNAKGGTNYLWIPTSNLNNPFIADPIAVFTDGPDTVSYIVKVSTPEGCYAYDSIRIFIFETKPEVFVPTAFTPNGDGRNDEFKATVAGIKQFYYLRVYNRWGQLLFETGSPDQGWDGTYKGNKEPSGTYVYVIGSIDYSNKSYFRKGTFVLIR